MALESIKVSCNQIKNKDGIFEKLPKAIDGIVSYDVPTSTAESVEKLGETVSIGLIQQKLRIFVQDTWRRLVANGTSPEEASKLAAIAKPGVTTRTPIDPKQAAMAALGGMSPDERKAFIASLVEAAKGIK